MAKATIDLEVWGGPECTINRVRDFFHSQAAASGHVHRVGDLERFAEIGLKVLRYPVLWEQVAPEKPDALDWRWTDERLGRMRELGIRPITGLVHHGSGPRYTSLVDPAFPELLATYARAVAERYPWLEEFTPVNEPLTTARFSGLYGCWYPHGRDSRVYVQALLNQCRSTVRAMQEIRKVIPGARLLQTEDLGKSYSTPALRHQAEYENERRWLSFDLLCGKVDRHHFFWNELTEAGATERDLGFFLDQPLPPDVLGINHYITSERYLDERTGLYPGESTEGNGRQRYVDLAAARVLDEQRLGVEGLLREAWERYGIPLAVTEAHLGCTREDQMRWLHEIWGAARKLRGEGVAVQAVTVWALLGLIDWNSLLTRFDGHYESGVFDLRSPEPRATALARMTKSLAETGEFQHPLLESPGWWKRNIRHLHPGAAAFSPPREGPPAVVRSYRARDSSTSLPPVLITGGDGLVGSAMARICHVRGIAYELFSHEDLDIGDAAAVRRVFQKWQPWAVLNAAGFTDVRRAEEESDTCFQTNAHGPALLAALCQETGARLLLFSSDLVFNGEKEEPFLESDATDPLNQFGASKVEMETRVAELCPSALIVRTSGLFGPWDEDNFATVTLDRLRKGLPVKSSSRVICPTYAPDMIHTALDLLIDEECGLWHLTNEQPISWADFARMLAEQAGQNRPHILENSGFETGLVARLPRYSALGSEKGKLMPSLQESLRHYFADRPKVPDRAAA